MAELRSNSFVLASEPEPAPSSAARKDKTEPIKLFEIDQPFCALLYGEGRCTAELDVTGDRKCYNTFATCQDKPNYSPNAHATVLPQAETWDTTNNITKIPAQQPYTLMKWLSADAEAEHFLTVNSAETNLHGEIRLIDKTETGEFVIRHVDSTGTTEEEVYELTEDFATGVARQVIITRGFQDTKLRVYIDGVELNRTTNVGPMDHDLGGAKLGLRALGNDVVHDECAIWDRVLTRRERFILLEKRLKNVRIDSPNEGALHYWYVHEADVGNSKMTDAEGGADIDNASVTLSEQNGLIIDPLLLRFSKPFDAANQYTPSIPSLQGIRTTPLTINLGGMDDQTSAFGSREKVKIDAADHPDADRRTDKYVGERQAVILDPNTGEKSGLAGVIFAPYDVGTFWSKWLARNPFFNNYTTRILSGYVGDRLADMSERNYVIEEVDGPDDASVSIRLEDTFSLIEERKAKMPRASRGALTAALADTAGVGDTFTVTPAGIGDEDYANITTTQGRVRINDEIFLVTRSGDTFTIVTRGEDETEVEAHEEDDTVQFCERFEGTSAQDAVFYMLKNYTRMSPAQLPLSEWNKQSLPNAYSTTIAEPTPVAELIAELAIQAGFTIWPDVGTNEVVIRALEAQTVSDFVVDDDGWILEDSLSIKRQDDRRVSQVWFRFGQRDPTKNLDEKTNFRTTVVISDLQSESDNEYGSSSIREIFSRWVRNRAAAVQASNRIVSIFRDPPLEVTFGEDVCEAGRIELAAPFRVALSDRPDDIGRAVPRRFAPVALEDGEFERKIRAQQYRFFKQPDDNLRVLNIDNDTQNYNVRDQYDANFVEDPKSGDTVRVIIAQDVRIWSTDPSIYAFDTGDFPSGVTLEVVQKTGAAIAGAGGDGGDGGEGSNTLDNPDVDHDGKPGTNGGTAVIARYTVSDWDNQGTIAAGGGGGGGGGGTTNVPGASGGGAAAFGDAGDIFIADGDFTTGDEQGGDGTFNQGGAGGDARPEAGDGGDGGNWDAAGQDGQDGDTGSGGLGGAAGDAIDGDGNITFSNVGDIFGTRNP